MRRLIIFLITLIIFFILQSTLLSRFSFFLIKPDLIFVLIILWSIRFGPIEGFLLGILAGIIVDSFGNALPLYVLNYPLFALISGFLSAKLVNEQVLETINRIFWLSFFSFIFQYFLITHFNKISFSFSFLFFSAFLNALIAPLIQPIIFFGIKK